MKSQNRPCGGNQRRGGAAPRDNLLISGTLIMVTNTLIVTRWRETSASTELRMRDGAMLRRRVYSFFFKLSVNPGRVFFFFNMWKTYSASWKWKQFIVMISFVHTPQGQSIACSNSPWFSVQILTMQFYGSTPLPQRDTRETWGIKPLSASSTRRWASLWPCSVHNDKSLI